MNTTTSIPFGRLTWNIPQDVSYRLADITDCINNIGLFCEAISVIFLLARFRNPKSHLRSSFFVIYTLGCAVDALKKAIRFAYSNFSAATFMYIYGPFWWFQTYFIAMWNTVLVLNRFIAIINPLGHHRFWTPRNTCLIIIFLMIYPFLINIYKPPALICGFLNYWCPEAIRQSYRVTEFDKAFFGILDIINTSIATVLCFIAVGFLIYKNKKIKQLEKVLLLETILSTALLMLGIIVHWLASKNGPEENATKTSETKRAMNLQLALSCISELYYAFFYFSGLAIMFLLSRVFRNEFLQFWGLHYLFRWFQPTKRPTSTFIIASSRIS